MKRVWGRWNQLGQNNDNERHDMTRVDGGLKS